MSTEAPRNNTAVESGAPDAPRIKLTTDNLKSTYCNTCNANTTREEVVLNFGINQSWDRGQTDLDISLEHRIILSPFAAKRLSAMLNKLMEDYEARYGILG